MKYLLLLLVSLLLTLGVDARPRPRTHSRSWYARRYQRIERKRAHRSFQVPVNRRYDQ